MKRKAKKPKAADLKAKFYWMMRMNNGGYIGPMFKRKPARTRLCIDDGTWTLEKIRIVPVKQRKK